MLVFKVTFHHVIFAEARDAEQRRCGLQIHADCEKLKETWAELGLQIGEWDRLVQDASGKLQELERALAECQLHLRLDMRHL